MEAQPQPQELEQQLQRLYSLQPPHPLILDTRPQPQYAQCRLAGSVNLPLATLTSRCYLLPDKAVCFAVVLPGDFCVTTTADGKEDGAVFLKGAASLQEFLSTRGWCSVTCYLHDSPELWAAAARLSVLEQGLPADPQQLARRCLFAPSGLLAAHVARIEGALLEQQQQQQLHALDLGCGSGRDVAWLASRQLDQQQQQPHWHVTGVDEWLGALERAADLAAAQQLGPDRVRLMHARICSETGAIQQLPVPPKSTLSASPLAAAAECEQHDSCLVSRFDLIMCCRFLVRALLPRLRDMLNPGGYILYCTFVDGPGTRAFGRPSGPERLLQPGELAAQHFGPAQGFAVLQDDVVSTADGREVCWFVARKTVVEELEQHPC